MANAFRFVLLSFLLVVAPAQEIAGTWFTTRGVLELEGKPDSLRGRYGDNCTLTGTAKGKELRFEAKEGQVTLEAKLTIDKSGHRFTGEWTTANGKGTWRGWRHDPAAEKGKAPSVAGFWRTGWGVLELEQQGNKLKGGIGSQGWTTVRGDLKGRTIELTYESALGNGTFQLDVDSDGKQAVGHATWAQGKGALQAQRLEGHARKVTPKPGAIVAGLGQNRLVYWLRAPKTWKPGQSLPLLVFLHGSNYCSKPYVETIGSSPLGDRYLVVGIDGERWDESSAPGDPRQNYTYANFMGKSTYEGYPNTHRESPALVAELLEELQKQHHCSRTFVGGHSQGGFLSWFFAMHYPDLVQGVFPMSSGMTMQCEPDVFADAALRSKQRNVAIAVVHGRNDDVVGFSQGEGTFRSCQEQAFPILRLFANEAGHAFIALPWIEAVQWLETMSSSDAAALAKAGRAALDEDHFRDVMAIVLRLRAIAPTDPVAKELAAKVDEYADGDAERFTKALAEPGDGAWIDDFLAFRDKFEFADRARDVMAKFATLRAEHEGPAKKLFDAARAKFNKGDRDGGWSTYAELVRDCWASSWAPRVKRWIADRK